VSTANSALLNSDSQIPPVPQKQTPPLSSLAEVCGTAGKSIRLESSKSLLWSALRGKRFRAGLWYVLRREFHTFLSRTRYALGSQAYDGTLCGPLFQEVGTDNFLPCQRTLARSQDMQQMPEVWQRWDVTPLDSEIFLLGWTAGERWALQGDRMGSRSQSLD
jgi:hypothetical protein